MDGYPLDSCPLLTMAATTRSILTLPTALLGKIVMSWYLVRGLTRLSSQTTSLILSFVGLRAGCLSSEYIAGGASDGWPWVGLANHGHRRRRAVVASCGSRDH